MLGLKAATDDAWITLALGDLDRVLVDHAHCEMKAASNALSLAARYPHDLLLVRRLTEVAQEEIAHFQQVLALLEARGLDLGTPPVDEYAAALRTAAKVKTAARGPAISVLVDRLLVAALIEARSCERFKLLSRALAAKEEPLAAFYEELFAAEATHYRVFVDLALHVSGAAAGDATAGSDVQMRLSALAEEEAKLVTRLAHAPAPAIHG